MKLVTLICLVTILVVCNCSLATLMSYDGQWVEIEGSVGTGSSETMIVIDWESGVTPSHAWLYQWNTNAVVADALDTIKAAYPLFDWSQTAFVQYINYNDGVDNHQTVNTGWLSFWNKDSGSWATNSAGVYDQLLTDGGWSGAIADDYPDWGDVPPTVPVPEPVTLVILMLGVSGFIRKRA